MRLSYTHEAARKYGAKPPTPKRDSNTLLCCKCACQLRSAVSLHPTCVSFPRSEFNVASNMPDFFYTNKDLPIFYNLLLLFIYLYPNFQANGLQSSLNIVGRTIKACPWAISSPSSAGSQVLQMCNKVCLWLLRSQLGQCTHVHWLAGTGSWQETVSLWWPRQVSPGEWETGMEVRRGHFWVDGGWSVRWIGPRRRWNRPWQRSPNTNHHSGPIWCYVGCLDLHPWNRRSK